MVSIFVEGYLDEIVLRKIVTSRTDLEVNISVAGKGKSYLRAKAKQLNLSAKGYPVIVLADQDFIDPCAADQSANWLGGAMVNENFLLRFATLSVESWLLADDRGMAEFLGLNVQKMPADVELLDSPKRVLVNLARGSRNREIRDELVPARYSTAVVGPGYNDCLARYVTSEWNIARAQKRAQSLKRAVLRIEELAKRQNL